VISNSAILQFLDSSTNSDYAGKHGCALHRAQEGESGPKSADMWSGDADEGERGEGGVIQD
jgi:hypothetical protein